MPGVTGPLWIPQLLLRSRQTAVDARTEDGTTALMLASRLAVEDLVEELIAAKADVGARDKRGMDLEKLMCHRGEVQQTGYEKKCKKRRGGAAEEQLQAGRFPPLPPCCKSLVWSTCLPLSSSSTHTAVAHCKLGWLG